MAITIPKAKLPAIIERIKKGSSLGQECKTLGLSYRNPLIAALREHMGRKAYDAMIESRRPGSRPAAAKTKKPAQERKPPTPKKKRVIPKDVLDGIVERLRNGATNLLTEAKALGMSHRTTLIGALREHMGRAEYDTMMHAKKATHRANFVGGKIERVRPDDVGVNVVQSMRRSDGWSWRYVTEHEPREIKIPLKDGKGKSDGYLSVKDAGERILIMISPEGFEYVQAHDSEKADLLRTNPVNPEGARIRFVEWEGSKEHVLWMRNHELDKEMIERGRAAIERKKEKANATVEDIKEEQEQHHKRISKNSTKAKKKATRSA